MSKGIKPEDLGAALEEQLTLYSESVAEGVHDAGARAMNKLVKLTKATAPKGKRGSFKRHITSTEQKGAHGTSLFIWHVKAPDHRLVHLLVNGHATKDGGRTKSNPFLKNAVDQVLPEYEEEVKEVLRNG